MLQKIREELKSVFVERDELIDAALVAFLCRQHMLIVGPPGTAKSMLAHEMCRRIEGAEYFHWLLTKFSTPEELFGPVSLKGLEHDEYYRITTGKLPEAHIAFLDEIFKASSSILNTLLTLINERRYFNGNRIVECPLSSLFASTNEAHDADELGALYDRFLFRFRVAYLDDEENFKAMLTAPAHEPQYRMTLDDLSRAQKECDAVEVPQDIIDMLAGLRHSLRRLEITVSDRRFRQSVSALRAMACLNARRRVETEDLAILRHVMWNEASECNAVQAAIEAFTTPAESRLRAFTRQADEIRLYLEETYFAADEIGRVTDEARFKVRELNKQLRILMPEAEKPDTGEVGKGVEDFRRATSAVEKKCAALLDGAA